MHLINVYLNIFSLESVIDTIQQNEAIKQIKLLCTTLPNTVLNVLNENPNEGMKLKRNDKRTYVYLYYVCFVFTICFIMFI